MDAVALYSFLYRQFVSSPQNMEKVQYLSSHVGSPVLRKVLSIYTYCSISEIICVVSGRGVAQRGWG